ncbi:MAG: hypothetical protein M3P95_10655 [Actinomycetota bacterium]|nr:hypothetical protein [Actinomycetota bacterium]
MDLTAVLPDLLTAARVGLDPGDAGLAVDPSGARTLAVIDRGAALAPEIVNGLAHVLRGLGVPAVLLLRSRTGRPTARDRAAWQELRALVDERLLPDVLVVGDSGAWSLRDDGRVPESSSVPAPRPGSGRARSTPA